MCVCQTDVRAGGVQLQWQMAITDTGRNHTKRQRPLTSPWGDEEMGGGDRESMPMFFSLNIPSLFTHNDKSLVKWKVTIVKKTQNDCMSVSGCKLVCEYNF